MKKNSNRKCYAYGSMVRKPMQQGGMMQSAMMNPVEKRQQQGMAMMAYGGKAKKKMAMGGENKEFAALAPPRDKVTYADKIAGAKKNA